MGGVKHRLHPKDPPPHQMHFGCWKTTAPQHVTTRARARRGVVTASCLSGIVVVLNASTPLQLSLFAKNAKKDNPVSWMQLVKLAAKHFSGRNAWSCTVGRHHLGFTSMVFLGGYVQLHDHHSFSSIKTFWSSKRWWASWPQFCFPLEKWIRVHQMGSVGRNPSNHLRLVVYPHDLPGFIHPRLLFRISEPSSESHHVHLNCEEHMNHASSWAKLPGFFGRLLGCLCFIQLLQVPVLIHYSKAYAVPKFCA